MPRAAAETFSNVLRVKEIKHDVLYNRGRNEGKVSIPFRLNPGLSKSGIAEELAKVLGENPHIKKTGSLTSRKDGLLVLFAEKKRHPVAMPKGLKK